MRTFFAFLFAYLLALGAAQAQITNPPPGNQTITGTLPITATGTCTGTVINCILGIASQALPGTTQTIHAAQWNVGNTYVVTTASQVFTLDASSTLSTNGGMTIQNPSGQSFTVTPNSADTINPETGGTQGASVTVSAGLSLITTDGAGKVHIAPTSAGGAPPTQTITQGSNITTSGTCSGTALSCTINSTGGGSGITFTDGTNNVNAATKLTVTGGTIGGVSPNATLTITPGSGGLSCPAGFTATVGSCIWTQTASASASLAWTGLINNSYELQCVNLIGTNSTVSLAVQVSTNGGTSYDTNSANYAYGEVLLTGGGAIGQFQGTQAGFLGPYQPITSGNGGLSLNGKLTQLQSAANKMWDFTDNGFQTGSTSLIHTRGGGAYTGSTSVVNAIRLIDIQATPSTFSGSCTLVARY